MSVYAWCEDSASGFEFWREIFATLRPDIIVETKANNSRLRIAAGAVGNDGNEYYILMDSFVDNADVLREIDGLRRVIAGKENVHLVDIRSFEFTLLSFRMLVQWVFAEEDELKETRKDLILARELFLTQVMYGADAEQVSEFNKLFPYAEVHNNEQTAAKLLYEITRNTGFETDKKKLGPCFIVNCCEWAARQPNDICGLDESQRSADNKKNVLVDESILKAAFGKVGL